MCTPLFPRISCRVSLQGNLSKALNAFSCTWLNFYTSCWPQVVVLVLSPHGGGLNKNTSYPTLFSRLRLQKIPLDIKIQTWISRFPWHCRVIREAPTSDMDIPALCSQVFYCGSQLIQLAVLKTKWKQEDNIEKLILPGEILPMKKPCW